MYVFYTILVINFILADCWVTLSIQVYVNCTECAISCITQSIPQGGGSLPEWQWMRGQAERYWMLWGGLQATCTWTMWHLCMERAKVALTFYTKLHHTFLQNVCFPAVNLDLWCYSVVPALPMSGLMIKYIINQSLNALEICQCKD